MTQNHPKTATALLAIGVLVLLAATGAGAQPVENAILLKGPCAVVQLYGSPPHAELHPECISLVVGLPPQP
jgi:hypothetical protein